MIKTGRIPRTSASASSRVVLTCFCAMCLVTAQSLGPANTGGVRGEELLVQQAHAKGRVGAKGHYAKVYSYSPHTQMETAHWADIKSYKKNVLKVNIGYNNNSYVTSTEFIKVKIRKAKGSFRYKDGFFHRGKGSIKLGKGWVKIKITPTSAPSRGMLTTGGKWIKLKKR